MNDRSNHRTDDHDDGDDADDVMAQLRAANPVAADPTAHTQPAAEALFQEIIMSDTLTPIRSTDEPDQPDGTAAPAEPVPGRRRWAIPAAVAAAALIATAAVAVWPSGGQTAAAAVRAAAESTESATSGTIEVSVDFSDDLEVGTVQIVTSFFGDDLDAVIDTSAEVDGSTVAAETRMRVVGDRFFVQGLFSEPGDPTWYESEVATREDLFGLVGVPTAITGDGADGLVALLVGAGVVERSDDDTYAASISVGDARRLNEVPAGLAFVIADDSELTDDQVLDLVVHVADDGRLDSLVIEVDEQETNSSARIEVSYRDLDAGNPIEVPADPQPMPDVTGEMPPEFEEPARILTEFFEANPGVCADLVDPAELVTCLRAGGHDEAADALEQIEALTRGG